MLCILYIYKMYMHIMYSFYLLLYMLLYIYYILLYIIIFTYTAAYSHPDLDFLSCSCHLFFGFPMIYPRTLQPSEDQQTQEEMVEFGCSSAFGIFFAWDHLCCKLLRTALSRHPSTCLCCEVHVFCWPLGQELFWRLAQVLVRAGCLILGFAQVYCTSKFSSCGCSECVQLFEGCLRPS